MKKQILNKISLIISCLVVLSSCEDSNTNTTITDTAYPIHSTTQGEYPFRIFPADNPWNQDISNAPLDPQSDVYITSLGKSGSMHADFGTEWEGAPLGQPYVVVSGSQKKVPVSFEYQSDPGPYPIPADVPIQGGPDATGDRHVIIIDKDNHLLYELYNAFPNSDGSWRAGSGAIFNLRTNDLRPLGWTSADAAGLPIYPGLVRYEEVVLQKEITHAIRFTANKTRRAFVYPARHQAGASTDPTLPPMGMRVRLKANYDISKFPENVQTILRGLKKYGMILADNGISWMISGAPHSDWDDYELHSFRSVPGHAFEVVKMGTVQY